MPRSENFSSFTCSVTKALRDKFARSEREIGHIECSVVYCEFQNNYKKIKMERRRKADKATPVPSPRRHENPESNRPLNSPMAKAVLPCNFSMELPSLRQPVAGTSKQTANQKAKKDTPFMNFDTSPKKPGRRRCTQKEERTALRATLEMLEKPLDSERSLEAIDADVGRMRLEDEERRTRQEKEWKYALRTSTSAAT